MAVYFVDGVEWSRDFMLPPACLLYFVDRTERISICGRLNEIIFPALNLVSILRSGWIYFADGVE